MIAPTILTSGLLLLNGALVMGQSATPPDMAATDGSTGGETDMAAGGAMSADSSVPGSEDAAMGSGADSQVAATDPTTDPSQGLTQDANGNMVNVQVVKVSNKDADLVFDPEEITADAGSLVQFQFYPKMHTLTQSTFDRPCEPLSEAMPNMTGIDSGPLPPENGMMKVFTMMINDTEPLWFYCATGDHCQQGMSMVVNPPDSEEKTLEAYKAASAEASGAESAAGEDSESSTGDSESSEEGEEEGEGESELSSAATSILRPVSGYAAIAGAVVAGFAFLL